MTGCICFPLPSEFHLPCLTDAPLQVVQEPNTICLSSSIFYALRSSCRFFFFFSVTFWVICLLNHTKATLSSTSIPQVRWVGKKKVCSFKHNSHVHAMFWYFSRLFGVPGENTHCVFSNHKQQVTEDIPPQWPDMWNLWEWVSACVVPEWSASIMLLACIGLSKVREVFNEFKRPI